MKMINPGVTVVAGPLTDPQASRRLAGNVLLLALVGPACSQAFAGVALRSGTTAAASTLMCLC